MFSSESKNRFFIAQTVLNLLNEILALQALFIELFYDTLMWVWIFGPRKYLGLDQFSPKTINERFCDFHSKI